MLLSDRTSLSVTGLTPNTAYNVSIVAFTKVGGSVPGIEIGRTNEDGKHNNSYIIMYSEYCVLC